MLSFINNYLQYYDIKFGLRRNIAIFTLMKDILYSFPKSITLYFTSLGSAIYFHLKREISLFGLKNPKTIAKNSYN